MAKRRRSKRHNPPVRRGISPKKPSLYRRIAYLALAVLVIGGLFYGLASLIENKHPPTSGATIANPSLLTEKRPFDIVYGKADAPVTIVEYASLTCGHCKYFHEEVFAPLKSRFIDTGKVRFIYRHYPLNKPALQAALLLSCIAPEADQRQLLKTLFITQDQWGHSSAHNNQPDALKQQFVMLSDNDYAACLADKTKEDALLSEQMRAQKELGINSTPTIFINGKLYNGPKRIDKITIKILNSYPIQ